MQVWYLGISLFGLMLIFSLYKMEDHLKSTKNNSLKKLKQCYILVNGSCLVQLTLKRNVPNNIFLNLIGTNCPKLQVTVQTY